jgi:hypothetical protein
MYNLTHKQTTHTDSEDRQHSQKDHRENAALSFRDNRSLSTLQMKLQGAADNSLQAKNTARFQEAADTHTLQQEVPIQKKENNTGLPDNLKSGIENLSGYSLDDVKVHYNSNQPAQLQAHAYAQGTDIHVAQGQEKHLPHEAWHVVQQKQGRVNPTMQLKGIAINDSDSLEKEADLMGEKALQMKSGHKVAAKPNTSAELGNAMIQMLHYTDQSLQKSGGDPLQFVSNGATVIQRLEIDLKITDFARAGIDEKGFAAYINSLGEGYSYSKRKLVTAKETFSQMVLLYKAFKDQKADEGKADEGKERESGAAAAAGAGAMKPATIEELRAYGAACVREEFPDWNVVPVDQIGKKNLGIYKITNGRDRPLIVKVLHSDYSKKSLDDAFESGQQLKKDFGKSEKEGSFEMNTLLKYKPCQRGGLKITLAIYYEQGVMSLNDALLHQDVDTGVLIGAARGLADRTARFHFAPIIEKKVAAGKYITHGDFNTSNIMLDFEGIMGLIDTEDLKQGSDLSLVHWDINSLFTTLEINLKERYPKGHEKNADEIFAEMVKAFKTQYIQTMTALQIPETKQVAAKF